MRYLWAISAILFSLLAAAAQADLPRVDRCKVVYAYEGGTQLVAGPTAMLFDTEVRSLHDACQERYRQRALPMPHVRLREHADTQKWVSPYAPLEGVDGRQQAWVLELGKNDGNSLVSCLSGGRLDQSVLAGTYHRSECGPFCGPRWPFVGKEMLATPDGAAWVVGKDKLFRIKDGQVGALTFPAWTGTHGTPASGAQWQADEARRNLAEDLVGGAPDNSNSYWAHQIYAMEGSLWLVRSYYSNCHKPGTFIVRFHAGAASVPVRLDDLYVTGLVRHAGDIWALVETRNSNVSPEAYVPTRILRIPLARKPVDVALMQQQIDDLGSASWAVRQRASEFLCNLPDSCTDALQQAAAGATDAEQKTRLAGVLESRARPQEAKAAELAGMATARLIFVDSQGRQYVQPWKQGQPQNELAVFDGQSVVRIPIPSAGLVLDCQGDDGRVWGHDGQRLYTLDPAAGTLQAAAELGALAGRELRVVATWKGLVCLTAKAKAGDADLSIPFWLDLSAKPQGEELTGEAIAEGMGLEDNGAEDYHVAVGSGKLWFVRYNKTEAPAVGAVALEDRISVHTQLCRATGNKVEKLSEDLTTMGMDPTVWPLGPDTAMVIASRTCDRIHGCMFYDQGAVHEGAALPDLVEKHHQRILAAMDDGAAFIAGEDYFRRVLARVGDSLFVEGDRYVQVGANWHSVNMTGIFRDGKWATERVDPNPDMNADQGKYEPLATRIVGVDARTQRVLGFNGGCTTQQWIPVGAEAGPAEVVAKAPTPWAMYWLNDTPLPRLAGGWTMAPKAVDPFLKAHAKRADEARLRGSTIPDIEAEYHSEDIVAMRRWDGKAWREIDQSFYGGEVYEDAAGGVWHFRTREAEVFFQDGRRQVIPLDAGLLNQYRLAVESPAAVWVASQQTLSRFALAPEAGGPSTWRLTAQYRLPQLGLGFAGPWIVANNLYWISGGKLWHTPLPYAARGGKVQEGNPER